MHAWTRCKAWARAALCCVALLLAGPAQAHKSSDAYLFMASTAGITSLRWDIALRDLDAALPLDADGDRQLTWGELRAAWEAIDALALVALSVPGCRFQVDGHALERRNDGAYAVLQLTAPCQIGEHTVLQYRLFADIDPTHRGILRFTRLDGSGAVRLLDPQAAPPSAVASGGAAVAAPLPSFLREGIHHIVTGYDHLLFLLCLLLPAVLRREQGVWRAVDSWRGALLPVATTVTLFTLAHSVTLALAALGWVQLSPSFVEPAIAVTIMLAALDNIKPLIGRRRGWVTFFFGLIHGFGFAGVLGELQLPTAAFGWALLQFNLGLELGQLAMVFLVVPVLFLLRRQRLYVPGVMVAGSSAAVLLAGVWLVERTADVSLLPF
ncbi:HupE/UreJ family protein [Aquabacterium sp.]|uniref:HupE/UreJ family protein n=1 Tax=Aquabacterium sp. TaxID=1872578 RepID=UPI002C678801|nr:HupE/UreJ family protein [Aquabacterium sp.]HSW07509.1 HupE/UreJ family protein [Aquabacterium sp.]